MLDRSVADKARYHYEMARMYANAGKNELALQYLRKALEEGFKRERKAAAGKGIRRAARDAGIQGSDDPGAACSLGNVYGRQLVLSAASCCFSLSLLTEIACQKQAVGSAAALRSPSLRKSLRRSRRSIGPPARSAKPFRFRSRARLDGPVLPSAALARSRPTLGPRPAAVPGISGERQAALLAGATRLISGYIERANGQTLITAVEEDVSTGKIAANPDCRRLVSCGCAGPDCAAILTEFQARPDYERNRLATLRDCSRIPRSREHNRSGWGNSRRLEFRPGMDLAGESGPGAWGPRCGRRRDRASPAAKARWALAGQAGPGTSGI